MSPPTRPAKRIGRGSVAVAAAAGGVAAAVVLERRHMREILRDDDYLRLTAPLGGRTLTIASADGTTLNARSFEPEPAGEPRATVVLAHGWTEQLSFWGPVIRLLRADGLRLVAYDLRGHGSSSKAADGDYSLDRFGDDMEAVLVGSQAAPEATIVVGHSLGAMSIAAWAQSHDVESRVAGAALVNTGFDDLIGGALVLGELGKRLNPPWVGRTLLSSSAPVLPVSTPLQRAVLRHVAFGPDARAGDVAFFERMLLECPGDVRAACGVALSDMDLSSAVTRLTVPTLVIAGELDRLTPPAHARKIERSLPRPAGLVQLPRSGHMSPLEQPEQIAQALLRLIGAVTASEALA